MRISYLMEPDPRGSMGLGGTSGGAQPVVGHVSSSPSTTRPARSRGARKSTAAAPGCSRPRAALLFLSNGPNVEAWDAATGKGLWYSQIGGLSSPPETFMLDGKQHMLFTRRRRAVPVRAELGTGRRHGSLMNTPRGLFVLLLLSVLPVAAPSAQQRLPNFIIVYADDMGYADIGPFSTIKGASRPRTPNLDRMAAEGIRLTTFYVAQAVCSASRAALLTGAYSNRVGILSALNHTRAARHQPGRDDDRRSPEAARLCHRDLWQVASRTPEAVPAAASRLRRILRSPVFERHVAAPPAAEELLSRPAAHRRRRSRQAGSRSVAVDDLVHRACGQLHRASPGHAILSLCPARHAARAAVRVGQVQGHDERRALRRCRCGDRLVGGPDPRRRQAGEARQRHARDLHVGQWPLDVVRESRRVAGAVSRKQGHGVRRRRARAVRGALAGAHPQGRGRARCRR